MGEAQEAAARAVVARAAVAWVVEEKDEVAAARVAVAWAVEKGEGAGTVAVGAKEVGGAAVGAASEAEPEAAKAEVEVVGVWVAQAAAGCREPSRQRIAGCDQQDWRRCHGSSR